MKFGFVLDNRKCIGCHACTVACKSEHDVPVGVNRTFVKQTEKGEYPNTKRLFSVTRCNHCTDAPCVEICPVECLHIRPDGIVDFNSDRCIGCKSCMQACPYDALYIDPDTHTAAKCNYCSHRVDIGLEPACVNICPEHAIISGDMDNPDSEISQLLAGQNVMVRKPEKGTNPNVFYINADEVSLTPQATERSENYMWNSQANGVGHYAKYAESLSKKSYDDMASELAGNPSTTTTYAGGNYQEPKSSMSVIMEKANPKRVYDTPDKGILWGWEVSGYVFTKAIAAGAVIVLFMAQLMGIDFSSETTWLGMGLGIVFLTLTGALLVKDLDQPTRFVYVILRPQWNSWLVKGGYAITIFGGMVSLWAAGKFFEIPLVETIGFWSSAISAVLVAVYTAFLFAQAKGRDFWQSPTLPLHMLIHSIMAGAAALAIGAYFIGSDSNWDSYLAYLVAGTIAINLVVMVFELTITHPTEDARRTVDMILKGRYKMRFWLGVVVIGNFLPLTLILAGVSLPIASAIALVGIVLTETIWVEAPQRIPLT
jgi:Fe-S-cluster-containing dehydrogenase component/formate-dependent nitrite reductase membrane component NrfD